MRLKAIFYSGAFIERYGDWLSASKKFHRLDKAEETKERENELLEKYKISIEVDQNFEPRPTKEVMEFVFAEYYRIYVINN